MKNSKTTEQAIKRLRPSECEAHYFIFIETKEGELVDVVMLTGYNREEAFGYLNGIWRKHERQGNDYAYTLTDDEPGNVIFRNHRN